MCRFIAYLGTPVLLADVLLRPKNSIIQQSINARESDVPLNGDGFGLGWYAHDVDMTPAIFKSIQPAWNDLNLQHLAEKIRSNCFFAHIRAASKGGVGQFNCHPFYYKNLMFMHNGDIGGFDKIKRHLRHKLSDEVYDWIKGQTDSEHFFALFIELLKKKEKHFNAGNASNVLVQTIHEIAKLKQTYGATEPSYINCVLTDGKSALAVRYVSAPHEKASTLYYAEGSRYEYHEGTCHIHPSENENNGAVLVVSEKLTNSRAEWKEVPSNHLLLVRADLSTHLEPID